MVSVVKSLYRENESCLDETLAIFGDVACVGSLTDQFEG
ncbi:MAG: hypothetical protein ACI93T_000411 [Porticoccaceae bacterium]